MHRSLCLLLVVSAALLVLAPVRSAAAHGVGLSRGEYRADATGLSVTCVFAERELFAEPGADERLLRERLRGIVDSLTVRAAGRPCPGKLKRVQRTEADGVSLDARFECASSGRELSVELVFLKKLAFGHRHAAEISTGDRRSAELLYRDHSHFVVPLAVAVAREAPTASLSWLNLGLEHILTGYDHLLFLFALVLTTGSLRSLFWVITSFTLGHSLSFALAGFGWVSPSPLWVEPAIALSIAYLGLETLLGRARERRARLTFPFGLVHGFGFAGALGELGVARSEVPKAVLWFNSGVELGQLLLIGLALPLVWYLRRFQWFERRLVRASSWGLVAVGSLWFLERTRDALFT
jgi:hydrogenase/urease accessory protein HupE